MVGVACLASLVSVPMAARAQVAAITQDDRLVGDAREAWRQRDRVRLLALRDQLTSQGHPLAPWAAYWAFMSRIGEAAPAEVDEFLARWPDSYVADRARNDWLLELGRRQDWATFLRIQPAFRMNDDREVSCLGALARHRTGAPMEAPGELREQARQFWWAQKDADSGCDAMSRGLVDAGVLSTADVWRKLRLSIEADKPRAVQQSARLLGEPVAQAISRLMSQPQSFLQPRAATSLVAAGGGAGSPGATIGPRKAAADAKGTKAGSKAQSSKAKNAKKKPAKPTLAPLPLAFPPETEGPLNLLAFVRWAAMDPDAAAEALGQPGARERWHLKPEDMAWAWAVIGRWSAGRLQAEAPAHFERALAEAALAAGTRHRGDAVRGAAAWSPDVLAWMARAGLRSASAGDTSRWALVEQAIEAMPPELQQDSAWQYWKAKALQAHARTGTGSAAAQEAMRQQARQLLARVAHPLTFYGQLAAEELHQAPHREPARPAPLSEAEQAQARALPGIDRALRMMALGWRSEGVREWNFTLTFGKPGGLSDRELLAVAEEACRREIWDRCINTSERTRTEIDLAQRYPTPFRQDVLRAASEVGLDPAYMYGLIRQESRFIVSARSQVGASGLMQVMPATASWTARKLNIAYTPDLITDRDTNLRLGAGYLKLVLDDFQGTQALAAAAYNAGPGRPRRWREGARVDAAAWVENVPFTETRDYVKKVLSNAVVYGHLLHGKPLSIKNRLGATIGPRASGAPASDTDLP
jgi:soluble lytic murein transglycosylase